MTKILDGKEVASAIIETVRFGVQTLAKNQIIPHLAIIRVGERPDDISYEKGVVKRCETSGIHAKVFSFPLDITQEELFSKVKDINDCPDIHAILLFKPLPKQLDEGAICSLISPCKDVDGITMASLAGVFSGNSQGFSPCTAQACMEILSYYGIELAGKKVVVIGRSLVVGKPVAMMLLQKDATVQICHTKTVDMPAVCRQADILIVAAGRAKLIGSEYFSSGQVVIDVGIHVDENGKLCGDVDQTQTMELAAISPVPGGVGTVTTAVLLRNIVKAAKNSLH